MRPAETLLPRAAAALLDLLERQAVHPRRVEQAARLFHRVAADARAGGWLRDLQGARLAGLLRYAAANSPYYRQALGGSLPADLDAANAAEVLPALPFTSPQALHDRRRFLAVPDEALSAVHTTSGSTGEPKVVGFTWRDLQRLTNLWALGLRLEGTGPLRALIALPSAHGLWIGSASAVRAVRAAGGLPLPVGTPHPAEVLAWMRRLAPTMVIASPSYLAALTRQAEREGYRATLDRIVAGGEPLDEERRAYVGAYWGAAVVDSYGATELGGPQTIARPGCRGLHLNELALVTEIVDPATGEAADEGELAFTTLGREAMPLVRYRIGDRARWAHCDCGLPLRCIELLPRSDDMIVVGGTHLFAHVVAERLGRVAGAGARLALEVDRVDTLDRLRIRVEGSASQDALRDALMTAYPRLRDLEGAENLRLEVHGGANLTGQVKAFRIVDRRG